jgi:hypothetical protein
MEGHGGRRRALNQVYIVISCRRSQVRNKVQAAKTTAFRSFSTDQAMMCGKPNEEAQAKP